ncbi:spore germination protein [Paenibacillus dendritiformis]|uniref:spore germination protein n=1 Tax=Paenibacillus dendritiformis TaxID=130049 RepID=UPI003669B2C9
MEQLTGRTKKVQWSDEGTENIQILQQLFERCSDVVFSPIKFQNGEEATLVYIDGLIDDKSLDEHVVQPLVTRYREPEGRPPRAGDVIDTLFTLKAEAIESMDQALELLLNAYTLLITHQTSFVIAIEAMQWDKREIQEPEAEAVVRGPREGFVENIQTNTSLLRLRIRTPSLKMETLKKGQMTKTAITFAYIEGVTNEQLIEEVRRRLNSISLNSVLDSGYVEQSIEDNPYSPFPQAVTTERPDVAASHLLEGRVVILVQGSPVVLIVPALFASFVQAAEDFYERAIFGTALRLLRYVSLFVALLGPSLYVSIITFHQEMIPTNLLLTMAKARAHVPFPALIEALLMEVMFEALREAGARLPKQIGSAVSIVGALVIGQAAISAGLVSAPMVMVVAITGIASFLVPHYTMGIAIRLLRFPIMLLSGFLGLLGLMMGVILLMTHLLTLKSFGTPYLTGFSPIRLRQLKDTLLRLPVWVEDLPMERAASRQQPNRREEDDPHP